MVPAQSHAWQPQNGAQAPEGAFVELERAAVDRREIRDDGKAEAGAGSRLVEPFAALDRRGARAWIEARTVIVDFGDEKGTGVLFSD